MGWTSCRATFKCEEKHKNKKPSLSSLPIGTRIKVTCQDGKEIVVFKHKPAFQFKRPFWMIEGLTIGYISEKHIPDNYEIINEQYKSNTNLSSPNNKTT